jgi:hypothetical protein
MFGQSTAAVQRQLSAEITGLLDDPVLHSYARICPEVKAIVDDARIFLDSVEPPLSAELNRTIACLNDQTMTQFETTAAGMRSLRDVLMKDVGPRTVPLAPVHLDFEPRITEEPLPVWWSPRLAEAGRVRRHTRDRQVPMRERWSNEIRALKRMGFGDESVILRALKETSGNVQRASELLKRHPPDAWE